MNAAITVPPRQAESELEILRSMRSLFSNRRSWVKHSSGSPAFVAHSSGIVFHETACLVSAFLRRNTMGLLKSSVVLGCNPLCFNDSTYTTHADILRLLDKRIAYYEELECQASAQ